MKGSTTFSANCPNIPPFTTDCQVHLFSASSSGSVQVYHDNGTASNAATLYVPWLDSAGNQVSINLAFSTQASPLRSISAANGTVVYVMVTYSEATGFTVNSKTGSAFTYSEMRNDAYGDIGHFAIFASITTGASVSTGSGGTQTFSGNGGTNPRVQTL